MSRSILSTMILLLVLLSVASPARAADTVVQFGGTAGFAYSPKVIKISEGDAVTWSGDFHAHPLLSVDKLWERGRPTGNSFKWRFKTAGTYHFKCGYHAGMECTVEVSKKH